MNERDFIYWLQGFLEVADPKTITEEQVQMIKDHVALVLTQVTGEEKAVEKDTSGPKKKVLYEKSRGPIRYC